MDKDTVMIDAENLVKLLSAERANDLNKWMQVGRCLHNINNLLLYCWINFSKLRIQHTDEECENIWKSLKARDSGDTMITLNEWAKQDSPSEYEKLIIKNTRTAILNTYKNTDQPSCVALVIHTMYQFQFKYTSMDPEDGFLYEFVNHKWVQVDGPLSGDYDLDCPPALVGKIRNEITDLYYSSGGDSDDIINLTNKFEEDNFIHSVVMECKPLFYDKNFTFFLDQNRHLIGFENGIYDLRTNQLRDGQPNDYISFTTGNNYIEYQDDDKLIKLINQFMSEIFPDDTVRNYVWILLSSFLEGGNPHEKFFVWKATKNSGIEELLYLFKRAFGKYVEKSPPTFLIQNEHQYELANIEAARLKNLRFVSINGNDTEKPLNASTIKEWTGGDKITYTSTVSMLDSPLPTYKPQFKMVYYSNVLPYLRPKDEAIWRRVSVLNFCNNFDPSKYTNINLWRERFMFLLLKHYKIYKEYGLVQPQAIIHSTQEYRQYCYNRTSKKRNRQVKIITKQYNGQNNAEQSTEKNTLLKPQLLPKESAQQMIPKISLKHPNPSPIIVSKTDLQQNVQKQSIGIVLKTNLTQNCPQKRPLKIVLKNNSLQS